MRRQAQTSDVQLHIGESRDSGFVASRRPGMTSFRWRARPRPLRAPQGFERLRHSKYAEIVEAAADDLHADRKSTFAEAAVDRHRRIFRHVPRHRVADVL